MNIPEKATARCSSCGAAHEVDVWSRINVADNPELKAKVKDGSLFIWECPSCAKTNLARYQTIYHDPECGTMVWMLPPGILDETTVQAIARQVEQSSDLPDGYTLRRVETAGDLVEKVSVFDSGLDDCVIEMCKYVTKMELSGKGGTNGIQDAPLKFYKVDGADNDLVFSYPLDGRMQGLRVGFNVYEDCAGIIRRNSEVRPEPGFARIDQDWVARFFK